MNMRICFLMLGLLVKASADGLADNQLDKVRPVPPVGIAVPADARASLSAGVEKLGQAISAARQSLAPKWREHLPDVEVLHKAVDWALRYDEFFDPKQFAWAEEQLVLATKRLESLRAGEAPWARAHGLQARGYRSQIDDSVQPYGLVIPEGAAPGRWRVDCWFHGRGEKLSELDFLHQRMTSRGEFAPRDAIVLHTYGRYCNGQRFAGEVDFFEALEALRRDFPIDDERIVVRGFSLGGAACWHIATHHAWRWCAAAPGAGFSETEQFLTGFQQEKLSPAPWERLLWNLYDSTSVAINLANCPTVAYSGEIDKQRQAAEAMALALEKDGLELTHVIGPKTAHQYEPMAKREVDARIDRLAAQGRPSPLPSRFRTFSLRYPRFSAGTIDAMREHWRPAELGLTIGYEGQSHDRLLIAEVKGLGALTIDLPAGTLGADIQGFSVEIRDASSGKTARLGQHKRSTDGSFRRSYHEVDGQWKEGAMPAEGLRKRHGLQGPVDDAFMERFLFVRPTGQAMNPQVEGWVKVEMERATREWRRQFRGDALVKNDTEISEQDMAEANLVLWGDPSSNAILAKIMAKMPMAWSSQGLRVGEQNFDSQHHALIAIYPNPLQPKRYVVLNSGFTFREYDYLNNARQSPKLPDWAVIDLTTAPNSRAPGKIAAADFFDEGWKLKPPGSPARP